MKSMGLGIVKTSWITVILPPYSSSIILGYLIYRKSFTTPKSFIILYLLYYFINIYIISGSFGRMLIVLLGAFTVLLGVFAVLFGALTVLLGVCSRFFWAYDFLHTSLRLAQRPAQDPKIPCRS